MDPQPLLHELGEQGALPAVVEPHRAIDAEKTEHKWDGIPTIKAPSDKILVAVAGGTGADTMQGARDAVQIGVVGTQARHQATFRHIQNRLSRLQSLPALVQGPCRCKNYVNIVLDAYKLTKPIPILYMLKVLIGL